MNDQSDFAKRLSSVVGSSAQKIEDASSGRLKARTIRNWIKGLGGPDPTELLLLARLTGRSPGWFLGETEAYTARSGDPEDMVRIPYLDVVVSAGAGRFNDVARALDHQPWPKVMIEAMGTAANIQCITASGDSMEPGILSGALVFVDRSRHVVPRRRARDQKPDIYVVTIGNDALVKRVDLPRDGLVSLISDNPDYPPDIYDVNDVIVEGRVVGWVNRL